MSEEEEEEPRSRKKKGFLSRKRVKWIALIMVLVALGAALQHYYIEPLYGETIAEKYERCLTQNQVLDERFVSCSNELRACAYDLQQCQQA